MRPRRAAEPNDQSGAIALIPPRGRSACLRCSMLLLIRSFGHGGSPPEGPRDQVRATRHE